MTDEVIGKLEMVNINTPDGDFGFLIGTDGKFVDANGKVWYGSQMISASALEAAYNGVAPRGEMTLAFFQDPDAPDLVDQIKALGRDYVLGREITFYTQPFTEPAQLYAPTLQPILVMKRTMRSIRFNANGPQDRTISVTFESLWERRRQSRRFVYNTTDHSKLIGTTNPSLEFIPTVDFQEQKLFD